MSYSPGASNGSHYSHKSSGQYPGRELSPDEEERKGLLTAHPDTPNKEARDYYDLEDQTPRSLSRKQIIWIATGFIALLVSGTFVRTLLIPPPPHPNQTFVGEKLRSNGTHDFKRTVVLVSIDGLRYVASGSELFGCQLTVVQSGLPR